MFVEFPKLRFLDVSHTHVAGHPLALHTRSNKIHHPQVTRLTRISANISEKAISEEVASQECLEFLSSGIAEPGLSKERHDATLLPH